MNTVKTRRYVVLSFLGMLSMIATLAAAPLRSPSAAQTTNDISIKILENHSSVAVGGRVTYTVVATNLGPDDASGVDVGLKLPAQLKAVSMTCDLGISADSPFCEYSSLPAGSHVVTTVVATPNSGTRLHPQLLKVTASTLFENPGVLDPDLKNNTASIRTLLTVSPSHP